MQEKFVLMDIVDDLYNRVADFVAAGEQVLVNPRAVYTMALKTNIGDLDCEKLQVTDALYGMAYCEEILKIIEFIDPEILRKATDVYNAKQALTGK